MKDKIYDIWNYIYAYKNIITDEDLSIFAWSFLDIYNIWSSIDPDVLRRWTMGSILYEILYSHRNIITDEYLLIYV